MLISASCLAQVGGKHIYKFLELSPSPRTTALGGYLISMADNDLANAWNNPGLINESMNKRFTFNYNFNLAKIKTGYLAYSDSIVKLKTNFVFGLHFVRFGDFNNADEFGNINGTFSANEYAFQIGASRQLLPNVQIGSNIKLITSRLEAYNSLGLALDFGIYYDKPDKLVDWGFVIKNVGLQLTTYNDSNRERIPFDIQLGLTKSFQHLPLRLNIVVHHLHRWNLLFDIPGSDEDNTIIGAEDQGPSRLSMTFDNLFRHFIFGGEFLLGKNDNLALRFGYNHQRRKEMQVNPYRSFAGFSGGFRFKVKALEIAYGFGTMHLAGSQNHIGISTSLDDLFNKKKVEF